MVNIRKYLEKFKNEKYGGIDFLQKSLESDLVIETVDYCIKHKIRLYKVEEGLFYLVDTKEDKVFHLNSILDRVYRDFKVYAKTYYENTVKVVLKSS